MRWMSLYCSYARVRPHRILISNESRVNVSKTDHAVCLYVTHPYTPCIHCACNGTAQASDKFPAFRTAIQRIVMALANLLNCYFNNFQLLASERPAAEGQWKSAQHTTHTTERLIQSEPERLAAEISLQNCQIDQANARGNGAKGVSKVHNRGVVRSVGKLSRYVVG